MAVATLSQILSGQTDQGQIGDTGDPGYEGEAGVPDASNVDQQPPQPRVAKLSDILSGRTQSGAPMPQMPAQYPASQIVNATAAPLQQMQPDNFDITPGFAPTPANRTSPLSYAGQLQAQPTEFPAPPTEAQQMDQAAMAQNKVARQRVSDWFGRRIPQGGIITEEAKNPAMDQNDPFPTDAISMLAPDEQRAAWKLYFDHIHNPRMEAGATPQAGGNYEANLAANKENVQAGLLDLSQQTAARAVPQFGGSGEFDEQDARHEAEDQAQKAAIRNDAKTMPIPDLATKYHATPEYIQQIVANPNADKTIHLGDAMREDAAYIKGQLPQTQGARFVTGQIELGQKLAASAAATYLSKDPRVGRAVFSGMFASDAAANSWNEAKAQGRNDQQAGEDASFSGLKAALVSLLPMHWSSLAKETAAVQMAGAYLSGTAITTGDAAADEAWRAMVRGEKVDSETVKRVGMAFLQGGLPAAAMHGAGMVGKGEKTGPLRTAEPGLTRPDSMATPELQAGDYGAGLGKAPPEAQDASSPSSPTQAAQPGELPAGVPSQPLPTTTAGTGPDALSGPTDLQAGTGRRIAGTSGDRLSENQPPNPDNQPPQPDQRQQNPADNAHADQTSLAPVAHPESVPSQQRELNSEDILQRFIDDAGGGKGGRKERDYAFSAQYTPEKIDSLFGDGATRFLANAGLIEKGDSGHYQLKADAFPGRAPVPMLPAETSPSAPKPVAESAVAGEGAGVELSGKSGGVNLTEHSQEVQAGPKPVQSLSDAELKAEMNGATGGRLSNLIKERTARERAAEDSAPQLSIEPHGAGLKIIKAGPEMTALKENWEGKQLARYNKKAGGWVFSAKNEAELKPIIEKINAESGKKKGFEVDQSMLGGVLQHSDTVAHYRAGDEKATEQASKGLVGTAAQSLKATSHFMVDEAKRFKGSMFPTMTRLGERSGDLASELVASKTFAKEAGKAAGMEIVGTKTNKLGQKRIDPELDKAAGAFLVQDNLDSIQRKFLDQADAAKTPEEKAKFQEMAANVGSLIGADGSPFDTRADFAKTGMRQDVQDAIDRYKQWFGGDPEENYRVSQGIAPDEELPTRGLQSEARVNLKAVRPDEPGGDSTIRTTMKGNLTNPRLKDSPFARMAKGNAPGYDISLSAMIENTLGKGTEIANQHRLFNQLVRDGIAKIGPAGQHVELGGKRAIPFEIEPARRFVVNKVGPEGEKTTTGFTKPTQKLYVRADAVQELRRALAVDAPLRLPVVTSVAEKVNTVALAGVTDAAFHISNQLTALVGAPGTGTILPGMVKNLAKLWMGGPEVARRLADLAKIGALKDSPPSPTSIVGKYNPLRALGGIIHATDRAGRLLMDDAFTKMADKGIVKDTPQNRRDFVNQFGQYNGRAQQITIAAARETGLAPFATAGTNFLMLGLKKMILSPGATATSIPQAVRLRATVLARLAAPLAMVATANYLKWGRMDGSANLPIGSLRLDDDKDGKMRYIDFGNLIGVTRGLRATGALAAIEGARRGESGAEIGDKAASDISKSFLSPFVGPAVRAGMIATTGKDAPVGGFQVAQTAEKGQSQAVENLKAAAKTMNPVVDTITSGKNSQLGRFTVKTASRADETQAEMLADRLAKDRLGGLNLPPSSREKRDARQEVVKKLRAGGDIGKTLNDAVSAGTIENSQRSEIVKESRQSALANKIERAPVEDALAVWDRATPAERADVRILIMRKIAAAKNMKPGEKEAAFERIKSGSKEPTTSQ